MKTFVVSALIVLGVLTAPADAQQTRRYRVPANTTSSYQLQLCSSEVGLRLNGDNDTDLDYWVYDNNERLVHSDTDSTDLTIVTLRPDVSNGCVNYTVRVKNYGSVYNEMTAELTDRGSTAQGTDDNRDRRVAIHNHTAEGFSAVRFSNTASTTYGDNRLASGDVQRARTNRTFNIDDGSGACRFDIQVTTTSGRKYSKSNVNVCSVSTVEFGTEISH